MTLNEFRAIERSIWKLSEPEVARILSPFYENAADWDDQVSLFLRAPSVWLATAPEDQARAVWRLVEVPKEVAA